MGLAAFLSALVAGGRVRVDAEALLATDDVEQSHALLVTLEQDRRDELPGTPPAFVADAARYRRRDDVQGLPVPGLSGSGTGDDSGIGGPPVAWSVVSLRALQRRSDAALLPDLVRLARGVSAEDPLVTELIQLAGRWPLSAVGITGAAVGEVDAIATDPCSLRLYVDRIIARHDFQRLAWHKCEMRHCRQWGRFPSCRRRQRRPWV